MKAQAIAGDSVELSVNFPKSFDFALLRRGMILCDPKNVCYAIKEFMAEITTFELKYPLIRGKSVYVHTRFNRVEGILVRIDKSFIGKEERKNPKCVASNTNALVHIRLQEGACMELYSNYSSLGRIVLRDISDTLASGLVTELLK